MADNDQLNDNFEFSDLDALNPDYKEDSAAEVSYKPPEYTGEEEASSGYWQKILLVAGVVIVILLAYRYYSNQQAASSKTQAKVPAAVPSFQAESKQKPVKQTAVVVPAKPATTGLEDHAVDALKKQVNQFEINQNNLGVKINRINSQFSDLNANMNGMDGQLSEIKDALSQLSMQLRAQSDEIAALKVRTEKKAVKRPVRAKVVKKVIKYHIQAVIPGRAWLIASNGSTITVSDGSYITGYGNVKLIDPIEGVVLTSSGKKIKFSQQDN